MFTRTRSFIDLFIECLLEINIVMTVNMISEGFDMPNWREHDSEKFLFTSVLLYKLYSSVVRN